MTIRKTSRSPFTTDDQPTFADLIARIQSADLPKLTRQNWCWALRTIARVAGKEPAAVPAHPEYLRRLMARAAPAAVGLGLPAWNNAKSLASKAMEWAGLLSMPSHYQAPFTEHWGTLWSKLPTDKAMACQLSRFFHYCSANLIGPDEVNDHILGVFHKALAEDSLIENPYECYRGTARSWNNASLKIKGWPQVRVTVPSKRGEPFSLPSADFPTTLSAQVEAHLTSLAGIDLDSDRDRPMRPATIQKRRKQLLWYSSALVHSGIAAASLNCLEVILRADMAKRGYEFLLQRRDGKSFPDLANLAEYLPALARQIGLPQDAIAALKKFKKALKIKRHGLAERHRATLQRFNDPAAVEALVNLPRLLRREVERSPRKGRREAKLLQTAVAIELLLVAPVRISNLASIETQRHLVEVSVNPRQVHLRFPAEEVKNEQDLEFPLPAATLELIDLYLKEYRHLLAKEPGDFLFPGKRPGRPKVNHALSCQIKKTVHKYTSLEMPAHRFRHAAAKIFLDRNPGQYEVVRQFLGHKDIRTTIAFYAGAEGAAAARHYHSTILKLRDD
jgi:integrase